MVATIEAFDWAEDLTADDLVSVARIFDATWAEWVPGDPPMGPAGYVDHDRLTAHPERIVRRLARVPMATSSQWGRSTGAMARAGA